jgi:hypothetical protein
MKMPTEVARVLRQVLMLACEYLVAGSNQVTRTA